MSEKEKGILKRAMGKAKSKISSTNFIKNLNQSEEFKKLKK